MTSATLAVVVVPVIVHGSVYGRAFIPLVAMMMIVSEDHPELVGLKVDASKSLHTGAFDAAVWPFGPELFSRTALPPPGRCAVATVEAFCRGAAVGTLPPSFFMSVLRSFRVTITL